LKKIESQFKSKPDFLDNYITFSPEFDSYLKILIFGIANYQKLRD
jgi:hypothetical protein